MDALYKTMGLMSPCTIKQRGEWVRNYVGEA